MDTGPLLLRTLFLCPSDFVRSDKGTKNVRPDCLSCAISSSCSSPAVSPPIVFSHCVSLAFRRHAERRPSQSPRVKKPWRQYETLHLDSITTHHVPVWCALKESKILKISILTEI